MISIKKILVFPVISLLLISLYSCDPNRVFDEYTDIKNSVWKQKDIIKFNVEIEDTLTPHHFFINVRNTSNYRFSNLYIFLNTEYPNGKISRDTINCLLADDNGKWLGKGLGDIKDNQYLLKKGVRFRQKGTYSFGLEQAMRIDTLQGIKSMGIRIEKIK